MDGMRKAALAISALRGDDRAWMLAQLPRTAQLKLRKLVREAAALALLPDAQTLHELTEPADGGLPSAAIARPLAVADARDLHALLDAEPDWLIAAVLRGGTWAWRAALLASLGAERCRGVEQALDPALQLRPRALQALCTALEVRLAQSTTAARGVQAPT